MPVSPPPGELRVPIVAEEARIARRQVETGRVRVRTEVDTREEIVAATLASERLHVERRAVEREVAAAPPPREEGDRTILSVVEERLVVTTKLFVVEEVVIRRVAETMQVEVPVTLRATRAIVDEQVPQQEID